MKRKAKSQSSSIKFRDWAKQSLDTYKKDVSPNYRGTIEYRLNKYILPRIGFIPIGIIKSVQVQEIVNECSGMSKSHITKLCSELYFYFDTARKNRLIDHNPAEDIIRPKGYSNKRRALSSEEREAFLRVCKKYPKKFRLFQLMLYAGCRPAEAWNVRYDDVSERGGVKYLHVRGTKTANSDRFVPIGRELLPLLAKTRQRGFCALTEGGNKFNATSYSRLSERLKREMNIELGATLYRNQIIDPVLSDDFVPYIFRHTFCTDLKKKGVDIRIARDLMGHSSIKTTADIYDHADDETLVLAAKQMGVI